MAVKVITTEINDKLQEITIKRIKVKDFKNLICEIFNKLDEISRHFDSLLNNSSLTIDDILVIIKKIFDENMDFIYEKVFLPSVDLSKEEIDSMDIIDLAFVIDEWLKFNNIDKQKIIDFFGSFFRKEEINKQFRGIQIPTVKEKVSVK